MVSGAPKELFERSNSRLSRWRRKRSHHFWPSGFALPAAASIELDAAPPAFGENDRGGAFSDI